MPPCPCTGYFSGFGANCPLYVGREPTSLPRLGDNKAGLMLNNRFTCEGYVTELRYFSGNPVARGYVGIWRQTADDEFIMKHQVELPPAPIGIHSILLPEPIRVDRGDFLGVHYDRDVPQGVVVNSIPEDSVLRHSELFQTQCVEFYRGDIQENQPIRLSSYTSQLERKTYALQAIMDYDVDGEGEIPGINKRPV